MLDAPGSPVAVASPRAVRSRSRLYLGLGVVAVPLVLAGFWPYFSRLLAGSPPAVPAIIHFHAAVFSGWLALLLVQVALVLRGRVQHHRRLGRFGMAYGLLILLMGTAVSFVAPARHVANGEWTVDQAAGFMILPFGDMLLFALFFGGAMACRRRPQIHKRMIVLTTIALLFPAVARLAEPAGAAAILVIWLLPLLIVMVNDVRTTRRVHVVYMAGGAILLIAFARVLLMESPIWLRLGRRMLAAFMTTALW